MSVSGLSEKHRKGAVDGALQAAIVGLHHAPSIHYTQGAARWEGIDRRRDAAKGEYPRYADCSSFVTWCYFNGLVLHGGNHSDLINGLRWRAGYTGTMASHGVRVSSPIPGDAILYGHAPTGEHTALYTGGGLVVSHGSEAGPLLLPWRYRSDVWQIRRYL